MNLFVMTAPFGAGKTTWIGRMLQAARRRPQLRVAGVYTPAVFEGGMKTAIDAMLLPDGERFLFAPRKRGGAPDGERVLGWDFQASALERINAHLAGCTGCDLLVVDELGPLELLRGEGYVEALALLDAGTPANALVVVRPALLDEARKRWGAFETLTPESDAGRFLDRLEAR